MRIGIYPGSFDPITLGHLDIISRASRIVDRLIIAVLQNNSKNPLFTADERVELIKKVIKGHPELDNVEVESFDGLLVDYANRKGGSLIVRGLRAITDFEYELQLAQMNNKLNPNIDTIFFTTSVTYSYLSSSAVKEIASFGGDISPFLPEVIVEEVYDKYNSKRSVWYGNK